MPERPAPNPHSPYADTAPDVRHIFPSPIFFPEVAPGVLALTACEGMAVVPEALVETQPDAELPEGLCADCVTVMQGGTPPKRPSSECGECGTATWHGELCALCRQEKHEAWWPTRPGAPRTNTPDVVTVDADGRKHTTVTMKRYCNGCDTPVGDVTDAEVARAVAGLPLPDVRPQCAHCQPLVELEAQGCTTWKLTPRSYRSIDYQLDRDGVFTKQFTEMVDGHVVTVGMRVGHKPGHVVVRFGDWLVRHPDGRFTVHAAPAAAETGE